MTHQERAHLARPGSGGTRNTLLSATSALLFVVAYGMVSAYSAPATVDMGRPGSRFRGTITDPQVAWIASLPSLAGLLGNVVSGYLSHRLGRKSTLMYASVPFALGWLSIAYAPSVYAVYAGRLVSGACAGVCAVAVPAYVTEVSTPSVRGLLSAGFQVAFALGVLLVTALGSLVRWSWLAVSGAALVVAAAAALASLAPESPPWLIREGRNVEAFQGLRFLRGGDYDEAAREFLDISDHVAEERREGGGGVGTLLRDPRVYRPAAIAVSLMMFQQFSGINALMAYSVELLRNGDPQLLEPPQAAGLVALVQVLATLLGSLLVDRVGRKPLYVTSGIAVALSLCVAGAHSFFHERGEVEGEDEDLLLLAGWSWVPLSAFVTYVAAFSLGMGPVPFVVTPEMVPVRTRSFLLALAQVAGSLFGFVATRSFDALRGTSGLGLSGLYWTYAAFALLGSAFYWTLVPETRGRTVRDIHRSFSSVPSTHPTRGNDS